MVFIEKRGTPLQSVAEQHRQPAYPISPLFYTRWSPRAMTGEPLSKEELLPLFEAARWAPSSYNNQPWRFIVANTPEDKARFFDFLTTGNQKWCKNAGALVIILSKNTFDANGKPMITHSLDTGSAWMSLALEGARRGYVVHGMEGFDYEKVRRELRVPEGYTVEAMCAIGKFASPEALPSEMRAWEKPSQRKPVQELVNFEGKFVWD